MLLKRFYDSKLAQASYLIGCHGTGEAIVVDPNLFNLTGGYGAWAARQSGSESN